MSTPVSIQDGTKKHTLKMLFDIDQHTLRDVKQQYIKEIDNTKRIDSIVLYECGQVLNDDNKTLGELGADDDDAEDGLYYSIVIKHYGGGGGGRANASSGGGQRRYKCNHKGCRAAFKSATVLEAHKKRAHKKTIRIQVVNGTKSKTLRKAFDPSYHTILDVKIAWCDEETGKDPSKVDLHDADGEVGDGILEELGYDVDAARDGIKFTIFYRCRGGAQCANILERKKKRTLKASVKRTDDACCIYGDKSEERTKMPCGHAFTAQSMFDTMKAVLTSDNHSYTIKCPICKVKMPYRVCVRVANLDSEEKAFFTKELSLRATPPSKRCPGTCGLECVRPEGLAKYRVNCGSCSFGDWCFLCAGKWSNGGFTVCGNSNCASANINGVLRTCKMKSGYDATFPEVRACPRCVNFIKHDVACRHMTCYDCGYEFCFVCLKTKVNGSWACGHYTKMCTNSVAPRQQF